MSRLFISVLGTVIFLLSSLAVADEKVDRKAEVKNLYHNYKSSLQAGDMDAALKLAEQLYAITPEIYGPESKTYATMVFNLAQVNELLNNTKKAAKLYQEHIDILDGLKVVHDEKYAAKMVLLSETYVKINDIDKALKYGHLALELVQGLKLPPEKIATYELRLGTYYFKNSDRKSAKRHIDKALDLFQQTYGRSHIKTAQALFWQAKYYIGIKKFTKAVKNLENISIIYRSNLKKGDGRLFQVHYLLAYAYGALGKDEKSIEHRLAASMIQPTSFDQDAMPMPIYKIAPMYPRKAQMMGKEGEVVVAFTVNEIGQVEDVKVIESSDTVFNKAAIKAALKFIYIPFVKDGKRVKIYIAEHEITFEMEK
ncbi:MAG: TonB family protein [Emcibacter sp.]|nr:TonB family protein [Emcibacter sp.]